MIEQFARHPAAANLLMLMMILAGLCTATNITTSLDPKVAFPAVEVEYN